MVNPLLFDAHCHLQDPSLAPALEETLSEGTIGGWIVNATHPGDWKDVAELAKRDNRITPAFGWHPWHITGADIDWQRERLLQLLSHIPHSHVGEIGVDRWKSGLDEAVQVDVLAQQLAIAADFNRPASIHCLKAWGLLEQAWEKAETRPNRVLLHAFNGSIETARVWLKRGAYFSYSTYFLHDNKQATCDVFAELPLDRILVETDAPAMAPPVSKCIHTLESAEGEVLNHPLNLSAAYASLAKVRKLSIEALRDQVASNFRDFAEVSR